MKREMFLPKKLDYEVLYPGIDDTSDGRVPINCWIPTEDRPMATQLP